MAYRSVTPTEFTPKNQASKMMPTRHQAHAQVSSYSRGALSAECFQLLFFQRTHGTRMECLSVSRERWPALDGSHRGAAGKCAACGWAVVQLDPSVGWDAWCHTHQVRCEIQGPCTWLSLGGLVRLAYMLRWELI